jgi:glutamine synthetase
MIEEIDTTLVHAGIFLEQWHPESSAGQYEFVLPPLPPLEAVDTLLLAREIISTVAAKYSIRATLHPKPFPNMGGTGSHVHMSLNSSNGRHKDIYESFYAGILNRLDAIVAFTYSNSVSYERAVDGCWAGGTWIAWGTQNRETPLRKISESHWEMKCFDGLANPYLALGYIIIAGSTGVLKKEPLTWKDCEMDPAKLTVDQRSELGITQKLPSNLKSALSSLQRAPSTGFKVDVISRYCVLKKAEMELLEGMSEQTRRDWLIERY